MPEETIVEDARHRRLLLDTDVVFEVDDSHRLRLPEGLVSEAIRAMDPATSQSGATAGSTEQGLVVQGGAVGSEPLPSIPSTPAI